MRSIALDSPGDSIRRVILVEPLRCNRVAKSQAPRSTRGASRKGRHVGFTALAARRATGNRRRCVDNRRAASVVAVRSRRSRGHGDGSGLSDRQCHLPRWLLCAHACLDRRVRVGATQGAGQARRDRLRHCDRRHHASWRRPVVRTFATSWIADDAPDLLEAEDPSTLLAIGAISSYLSFAVGWLLFGIASYRARVFPTAICVAIAIGGVLGSVRCCRPPQSPSLSPSHGWACG